MSFLLKVTNPNQELVLSSDAKGMYCIGRAVYQGIVHPSGSPTGVSPGAQWGYSTYRISHPGPIIAAIDLPLNKHVGIVSVTQPLAGVWEITCYCGDTSDSYSFDTAQYPIDVWAFGVPATILNSSIGYIRAADGSVAYDFSRPNLLFPRAHIVVPQGGSATIPALTRPVALGCPTSNPSYDALVSTNRWAAVYFRGMWVRSSSTALATRLVVKQRWEYSDVDPIGISDGDLYNTPAFILEGAMLP